MNTMFVIFFLFSTPKRIPHLPAEQHLEYSETLPDCLLICKDLSGRLHYCISKLQAACLLRA